MTIPSIPPSAYTPNQIAAYLRYIRFPPSLLSGPRDIHFLRLLHALQIASVPYENLSLHYNPSHSNSLSPHALYDKIISPAPPVRGRGGYCLETAVLYLQLLRGLGFDARPSMARIRLRAGTVPQGLFIGYVHLTSIVTLPDGSRWSSDVGFGGDGPTAPLRLVDVDDAVGLQNLGAQRVRIARRVFREGLEQGYDDSGETHVTNGGTQDPAAGADTYGAKMPPRHPGVTLEPGMEGREAWFYQYRNGEVGKWLSYYAFSGEPADEPRELELVNDYTSADPNSFQRSVVLAVKFIVSEAGVKAAGVKNLAESVEGAAPWVIHRGEEKGSGGDGLIAGKIMLVDGVVKRNLGGRTEVLRFCKTESERIQALREFFGIELTDEQKEGIRGFKTELRNMDDI